jgi:hypothetical protein
MNSECKEKEMKKIKCLMTMIKLIPLDRPLKIAFNDI